jgi:hypothetical protein
MEEIQLAIQAAASADANAFREHIGAALSAKISDALDLRRIEIASNMLAPQEEVDTEDQEIVSDEDV